MEIIPHVFRERNQRHKQLLWKAYKNFTHISLFKTSFIAFPFQ